MANYYFNEAPGSWVQKDIPRVQRVKVNSGSVEHVQQLHVCQCSEIISMDVKARDFYLNGDGTEKLI